MKKLSIILACVLLALAACTKSKEVHPELGDGNDEIVTVGMKDVYVKYTRTDHAELSRVVFHYSLADVLEFKVAEMVKRETFFELMLNSLESDTLYDYYYELFYNGGESLITEQKKFHTQAFDTPEPPTPPSDVPEGAINGLFTINENGDQVYFSQGSLQYQASTNTWRFAENQWDYVGAYDEQAGIDQGNVFENGVKCNNKLASPTYEGWIDLFGWGTSGYNHGANCYTPWSFSDNSFDYYAYGDSQYNLYDQNGQADWGYNKIYNGGNAINQWRTIKREEWDFVFNHRNTISGIRYAKVNIEGHYGIVLLPDGWDVSNYAINDYNNDTVSYDSNSISISEWNENLEANGAVLLPAAGYREGASYYFSLGNYFALGDYWSSSYYNTIEISGLGFNNSQLLSTSHNFRWCGRTVRLVQDAQ